MARNVLITVILVLALALGGCASPARTDQMAVRSAKIALYQGDTPLKESIRLKDAYGGEETNPLWTSEIGNSEFRLALEDSLRAARLLERNPGDGKYALEASLMEVDQPLFGMSFTVTTDVDYLLLDTATGNIIFKERITAPFTATVSDAFLGIERLKIANEGSARQNIERLIDRLYQLDIQDDGVSIK